MDNVFLEELFYLLTLPLLPFIIHYFYNHFFQIRFENKIYIGLLYSVYLACTVALHYSPLPGNIMLILNAALIIFLSFFYYGNYKWRICAALFIFALILLTDSAMFSISTTGYIVNLFLSKFLMFMLVLISVRITNAFGEGNLSAWYWILLFICPFISILGVAQLSSNLSLRSYPILFPTVFSGLLIINFLIFILCDRVLCIQAAQSKNQLLEQQNAYYVNQYLVTKDLQEESLRFRHDYKNILLGLRAKVESERKESSIDELDHLIGNIESSRGVCNTENMIIDSIINYKQQVAEKYQIPFSFNLNIPPNLELDTTVTSVILGNVLDNAIEACTEKKNVECYIKMDMQYLNESLFVRIQNPFVNNIRTNFKGEIISTKSDKQVHGIGLKSVKKIVDDCNGLLDISYENSVFQIDIVLFGIRRN